VLLKEVEMYLGKVKQISLASLALWVVPVVVAASLATTASFAQASMYTESVNLGVAGEYSVVAGAAITIGAGTVLTGETISDVSGTSSGSWTAATFASASAVVRTATSISGATDFPVNRTFTPGVYRYTSYVLATGDITLDAQNDPNAVFIFQIGGYLSTESGFRVLLTNGAIPANVYWQVDGYFSAGASTSFKGIVLAGSYVTTGAAMTLNGKLFALGGAVTIGASNVISNSLSVQSATWNPSLSVRSTSSPVVLAAATGIGGGLVSYSIADSGTTGCSIVSSTRTLSYVGSGSCVVTATIAPTNIYAGTTVSRTFLLTNPSIPTGTPSTPTGTPLTPTTPNTLISTVVPGVTNGTGIVTILTSSKDTMHLVDGNLHVFLRGLGTTGKVLIRGKDGVLNLRYGGTLQIRQAKGFAPNSLVRVSILSPVKLLRTFRTNESGEFSGSVYLRPSSHSGLRMLKITGYKPTGSFRTLWVRTRFPSSASTHSGNCHIHLTKTLVKAC
jgi:hypothetical protein